jgi:hypothetical protein
LEENGIPTVVVGSARDVVEECGVARFLFTDFPLGNPFGKPWDKDMQSAIMDLALDLLTHAWQPRTTVQAPFIWSEDDTWRTNFMQVTPENKEALLKAGQERRAEQARVKAVLNKKD